MATALNNPLLYDPRHMDFEHWASLMCEQYAAQQLAIPTPQTDWQEWGAGLLAIDLFTNQGFPSPYAFSDWKDWVSSVLNVMSGGR